MADKKKDADSASESGPESESTTDETTEDTNDEDSAPALQRVERPIGESRDNLRRRSDWFRRRSGGTE
jgi:hypothetical protein